MMYGAPLLLTVALCAADGPADDTLPHKRWTKIYREIAESFKMRRGATELTLLAQPLNFYTNPVRGNDQHGAIFLWTEGGRPAVIASIWSALNRQNPEVRVLSHEWHSLSVDPDMTAAGRGITPWRSGEPGVVWLPVENASRPAASRSQRLIQMRSIVRRYAVEIDVQGESELRLMEQPLYRYPEQVEGALDGAIFAFAMATDPELLLLLESRESAGQPVWHIAYARFGNKAMTVKEGDRTVWSCEAGAPGYSDGKYYLRWRAEEMPALVPDP
jgi:hypothetical protein